MKTLSKIALVGLVSVAGFVGLGKLASAQQASQTVTTAPQVPIQQAVQTAEATLKGKATRAELIKEGNAFVYEVEVDRQQAAIDATSGQVIETYASCIL
ncbi:MAG: PepSY domain-containing protein [Leptolyngbya sp. UWPOB_LEPTO1]|uniref:PepSY domain-containing protein n=1 Tax=Leptolyngbya sp. UWPOB_LEPTO1 TaxID=2815653 RepID=UPI001ACAF876|nr:PepSY domain-containing protein [Leptolyngbya sp. UWPOB_LEPTO1]MBN8560159.1 PepSY domain-containing protein [Leptolyngbya sp. UWPOB_LEPTO1]